MKNEKKKVSKENFKKLFFALKRGRTHQIPYKVELS